VKEAAPAAGIPWNTAKDWLAKGREGVEPYARFVADVEEAKATWAAFMIQRISSASANDWRAAAYLLERRVAGFYKPEHRDTQGGGERVILLYPVPMPLGAEPAPLRILPGHAYDAEGGE
jgi:hypothetical protein